MNDAKYWIEFRKQNYWRGFRACLVFILPVIVYLSVIVYKLLITQ